MSGLNCSDRATQNSGSFLCYAPEGHVYAALITSRAGYAARILTIDGRRVSEVNVAKLEGNHAIAVANPRGAGDISLNNIPAASIRRTLFMEGTEIGDCFARGGNVSFAFLQTTHNGAPIGWGPEHLREIYRLLGQKEGQFSNAFFCSNQEDQGQLAINNDVAHRASLLSALKTLESGENTALDTAHREAAIESLRAMTGMAEPPEEKPVSLTHLVKQYWPLAILFGIQGPSQAWRGVRAIEPALKAFSPVLRTIPIGGAALVVGAGVVGYGLGTLIDHSVGWARDDGRSLTDLMSGANAGVPVEGPPGHTKAGWRFVADQTFEN